ncbi:MarR family winged helix-turn-helix transcriptional regulator [Segnochrobactrum spirostomi]|uniref:Winged helix-turn-helix transcriptional regulator n=1 Tax=Segnochrobactrum spirostomi TaxID=2608987 RepID=A0A6A7XYK1_9HYPH|nr:MarR family winged helix-turn-helix transcriptional regulator [Segnochrobactrum spirostomi]MQT11503.1 winged helix-turn-helix transcriptional regulator [Segnochrobactrum spirostomi]
MTNFAARLFAQAIARELRPLGVSPGQLPVFFALADGSALSQKALVQAAATEQPSMAEALSRMQKDGWVQREPDPQDGRSFLYSLTPAALEKTDALLEAVRSVNATATADLTQEECAAYFSALNKIVGALKASIAGA